MFGLFHSTRDVEVRWSAQIKLSCRGQNLSNLCNLWIGLFWLWRRCNLHSPQMNEQAFTTLEYPQLRELVQRGAQTENGRARIHELEPASELNQLKRDLAALSECVTLRNRGVNWSFTELQDPGESLSLLRVEGAALDPTALLQLSRLCEQALQARAAIMAVRFDPIAAKKHVAAFRSMSYVSLADKS